MSIRAHHTPLLAAVGTVLLVAGAVAIVIAVRAQRSAPQPPASAASPISIVPSSTPGSTGPSPITSAPANRNGPSVVTVHGPVLPRSIPTHLSVPAIGVDADLKRIGLDTTGRIRTPPLERDSHAYWLSVSPTPGQPGPATIIGHVDSAAYGPGVFFRLGALRQRDTITVTRADGTVAEFEVERVVAYPKARFPTHAVYGNTDHAALRLITCGGTFDAGRRSYQQNIVAYAALVSTHRTRTRP
jgi:sortase (surface protein transpeptidase)